MDRNPKIGPIYSRECTYFCLKILQVMTQGHPIRAKWHSPCRQWAWFPHISRELEFINKISWILFYHERKNEHSLPNWNISEFYSYEVRTFSLLSTYWTIFYMMFLLPSPTKVRIMKISVPALYSTEKRVRLMNDTSENRF